MDMLRHALLGSASSDVTFRPTQTVIEGLADLRSAQLGHLDLRGLTFRSFVDFRRAELRGVAWFDGAVFGAGVDFSGARFDRDARFDRAVFEGEARFVGTEFRGVADFDGVQFKGSCAFDQALFFANASFGNTIFRGMASFRGAQLHGGLWLEGADLAALDVAGMVINGRTFLDRAVVPDADRMGLLRRPKT